MRARPALPYLLDLWHVAALLALLCSAPLVVSPSHQTPDLRLLWDPALHPARVWWRARHCLAHECVYLLCWMQAVRVPRLSAALADTATAGSGHFGGRS